MSSTGPGPGLRAGLPHGEKPLPTRAVRREMILQALAQHPRVPLAVLPTPLEWTDTTVEARIADTANEAARLLGLDERVTASDVCILHDYIGAGYARPTSEGLAAMRLTARTDAILLDPVYTGKAMAGLIDHARLGRLHRDDTVIFVHTGGVPAAFAYRDAIVTAMR